MSREVEAGKTDETLASPPPWVSYVLLILILAVAAFIRIRLIDLPLERDEGEYAYAGRLMLEGVPPYQLAYNMKLPGTYAAYALIIAVFGDTPRGIHAGLIVVTSLTTVLLWLLGRRLVGPVGALAAAAAFALLSMSGSVLGLAAHATHFVTLFAVAGWFLLLKGTDSRRVTMLFSAGLLFGFAFLMKQPGVAFGAFAGIVLLVAELRRQPRVWRDSAIQLGAFFAGAALPFALTCILLWLAGVIDRFWFWTFSYARAYVGLQSLSDAWLAFKTAAVAIFAAAPGVWLLTAAGVVVLLGSVRRATAIAVLMFLLASLAAASPGLYFRGHYFIPLLAAAALCAGAAAQFVVAAARPSAWRKAAIALVTVVFIGSAAHSLYAQREILFHATPQQASRRLYGANPFPESLEIGRYLREISAPDARIGVIGSEPQIYLYSGRRSATGYIYTYGLMEPHAAAEKMQREMIAEIEAANPEFLVFVAVPTSWQARPQSPTLIFDWFDRTSQERYRQIGLVDIRSADETVYRWGENAVAAVPRSRYYVTVFKRNDLL